MDADAAVSEAATSSGQPLPRPVQHKFEGALGANLSEVRVHTGEASASAAHSVGARAYTIGQNIHFADGEFDPASKDGELLLAHEVAHTVQQTGDAAPQAQFKLEVSQPQDQSEVEADAAASAMVDSQPATVSRAGGTLRQRVSRSSDDPAGDQSSQGAPQPTDPQTQANPQPQGDTPSPISPDSASYKAGYQDGRNGLDSCAVPWAPEQQRNYNEGYARGHYEFTQSTCGGSQAPDSPQSPQQGQMDQPSAAPPPALANSAGGGQISTPGGDSGLEQPNQSMRLPSFRYNLSSRPVSVVPIVTPTATVNVTMGLRGNLTFTPPSPTPGVSIDQDGLRVQSNQKMGQFTSGLRISGVGGQQISLGSTLAGSLVSTEYRYIPPNTWRFICQEQVASFVIDGWQVAGTLGFDITAAIVPNPSSGDPDQATDQSPQAPDWWSQHWCDVIGGILFFGVAEPGMLLAPLAL